jgi:hypothetical protein
MERIYMLFQIFFMNLLVHVHHIYIKGSCTSDMFPSFSAMVCGLHSHTGVWFNSVAQKDNTKD